MDIRGARIIVTGGANGLGFGIVKALIDRGAVPVIIDRDSESLKRTSELFGCSAYLADVTSPEQVNEIAEVICKEGVPCALINNAGAIRNGMLINLLNCAEPHHSLELWNEVISLNLTSTFLMTRVFADRMVRARIRGTVVNMSSIAARGNAGQGAYAAAKGGVEALTLSWAKEIGPLGLRFVAVAPGFIDTPSTRAALNEEVLDELKQKTPLRKLGDVTHVASAVLYALENDMLTGTVLDVDGGLTL